MRRAAAVVCVCEKATYKPAFVDAENRCVHLEEHLVRRPHGLEALHRDVLLIAEAQPYEVQRHEQVVCKLQ